MKTHIPESIDTEENFNNNLRESFGNVYFKSICGRWVLPRHTCLDNEIPTCTHCVKAQNKRKRK